MRARIDDGRHGALRDRAERRPRGGYPCTRCDCRTRRRVVATRSAPARLRRAGERRPHRRSPSHPPTLWRDSSLRLAAHDLQRLAPASRRRRSCSRVASTRQQWSSSSGSAGARVQDHLKRLFGELGVGSRRQLVAALLQLRARRHSSAHGDAPPCCSADQPTGRLRRSPRCAVTPWRSMASIQARPTSSRLRLDTWVPVRVPFRASSRSRERGLPPVAGCRSRRRKGRRQTLLHAALWSCVGGEVSFRQ